MNKLLIHHQNTILIENKYFTKEEQFFFDVDSDISDIDFYISQQLSAGNLQTKISNADLLFIKVALSSNYLEYAGLRLAYHIRLTKSLGDKSYLPIVFIAEESYQFLGLTSELPEILFTNGIYLTKDNSENFNSYIDLYKQDKLKALVDLSTFMNKIKITPPSNYQSHHSIANEWSLLQWSELLGISTEGSLETVKENVESLLYYKYLLAKKSLEDHGQVPIDRISISNLDKILYIDDEWDKGWAIVLQQLFFNLCQTCNYKTLETSFKDLETEQVLKLSEELVLSFSPDIVILDLRLCDKDFKTSIKTEELTGYKILQFIKSFNPGIQVIIFSASNKVWNLIELQNAEADGFVLKDSPEVFIGNTNTSESVNSFIKAIKISSDKFFLKKLFNTCKKIHNELKLQYVDDNYEYKQFINSLKSKLRICVASLKLINLEKKSTIDIAFLSFYNFLEAFSKYYITYNKKDHLYYIGVEQMDFKIYSYNDGSIIDEGKFIKEKFDPSWSLALKAIFIDYFEISSSPYSDIFLIEQIQRFRNDFIHSTKSHIEIDELITIVELSKTACSKLKD